MDSMTSSVSSKTNTQLQLYISRKTVLPWNDYRQNQICFLAQVETTWWQIAEHISKFIVINEQKEVPYQYEDTACKAQLHCLTKMSSSPWATISSLTLSCNSRRTEASCILYDSSLGGPGHLKECQITPDSSVWSTALIPSLFRIIHHQSVQDQLYLLLR